MQFFLNVEKIFDASIGIAIAYCQTYSRDTSLLIDPGHLFIIS
jgi:hypothetical protein